MENFASFAQRVVLAMLQIAVLDVRNAFVMNMKMFLLEFVIKAMDNVFARIIHKDFIVTNVLKVSLLVF